MRSSSQEEWQWMWIWVLKCLTDLWSNLEASKPSMCPWFNDKANSSCSSEDTEGRQTHDLYSSMSPLQDEVRKHEVTWRHLSWQTQRHRHERRPILACTDPHWPQMASIIPDVGGCQDRWTAICSEEHTGTQRASLFSFFKSGIRDCLHMDISVWRAVFLPSGWLISRVSLHLVAEPNIKRCLAELLSLTSPHKET